MTGECAHKCEQLGAFDQVLLTTTSRMWNTLPQNVMPPPSLTFYRKRLKTHLFNRSFPESPAVLAQ